MEPLKNASSQEVSIISLILSNDFSDLCGLHNLEYLQEVFEKFKKDILFLVKINQILRQNLKNSMDEVHEN